VAWAKGGSVCKTATLTFQRVLDNLDVFLVADYVCQNGLHSHLAWAPACVRMKSAFVIVIFDPLGAVRGLGTTKVCRLSTRAIQKGRGGHSLLQASLASLSPSPFGVVRLGQLLETGPERSQIKVVRLRPHVRMWGGSSHRGPPRRSKSVTHSCWHTS
jgi:hypothetical protein